MPLIICPTQEKANNKRNHWNELVAFRDSCNQPELSSYAEMLLRGLNTAGGICLHREIETFLDSYSSRSAA